MALAIKWLRSRFPHSMKLGDMCKEVLADKATGDTESDVKRIATLLLCGGIL